MRRVPKSWRNVGVREFIHGDFDRDKTPNVDDPYPFDPKRKGPVEETSLSRELLLIEKHNRKFKKATIAVGRLEKARRNGQVRVSHRIKGPYSTINKLRRYYLPNLQDIGGVRVLEPTTKRVHKRAGEVKASYPVVGEDNYYRDPKDGYYFARHVTVKKFGLPVEVQIKTPSMQAIHDLSHSYFKEQRKPPVKKFRKMAKRALKKDSR